MNDYQCNLGFINIFILFDSCFQLYRLWLAELPWELGQLGQFGKVLAKIWPRHSHTQNFLMQSAQKYFRKLANRLTQSLEKHVYVGGLPREYCQCLTQQAPLYWKKTASHPTLQCFPSFVQEFSGEKKCKSCSSSLCLWWNYYLESSLSSWETHSFQVLEQKSRSNEQLSWPALY